MITVTLCYNKKGEFVSCNARGHSKYAENGNDIVCSACSILIRTLVLDMDEKAKLNRDLQVTVECAEKGEVSVDVQKHTSEVYPYLSFLFGFLKKGFESLSSEYPENIKFRVLSVD